MLFLELWLSVSATVEAPFENLEWSQEAKACQKETKDSELTALVVGSQLGLCPFLSLLNIFIQDLLEVGGVGFLDFVDKDTERNTPDYKYNWHETDEESSHHVGEHLWHLVLS